MHFPACLNRVGDRVIFATNSFGRIPADPGWTFTRNRTKSP